MIYYCNLIYQSFITDLIVLIIYMIDFLINLSNILLYIYIYRQTANLKVLIYIITNIATGTRWDTSDNVCLGFQNCHYFIYIYIYILECCLHTMPILTKRITFNANTRLSKWHFCYFMIFWSKFSIASDKNTCDHFQSFS